MHGTPCLLRRCTSLRRVLTLVLVAAVSGVSQNAAADEGDVAIGATLGTLAAVDTGFAIYNLVSLTQESDVHEGAATAQAVIGGMQTGALNIASLALVSEGEGQVAFGLTFPTMLTGAITSHAVWSLVQPDTDRGTLVLGSTLIGVNHAYTVAAIAHALRGEPSSQETAIGQLVTGLPSVGISAYQFARADSFRAGWLGLTVWSGALVLHGTTSLFVHADDSEDEEDSARRSTDGFMDVTAVPMFNVVPGRGGTLDASFGFSGRF